MATNIDGEQVPEESHSKIIELGRRLFEDRNYRDALGVYLRLAETRYGAAIHLRIGWMYEFGMGTDRNEREAEYWYREAANTGNVAGFYCIASMRFRAGQNDGVKELMEKPAARGYAPALFHLGQMYRFGKGNPADVVKAYEYYEKAAALGHVFARRAMAQRMIQGDSGLWRIPIGLLSVLKIMWDSLRFHLKNPSDDRLKRLA